MVTSFTGMPWRLSCRWSYKTRLDALASSHLMKPVWRNNACFALCVLSTINVPVILSKYLRSFPINQRSVLANVVQICMVFNNWVEVFRYYLVEILSISLSITDMFYVCKNRAYKCLVEVDINVFLLGGGLGETNKKEFCCEIQSLLTRHAKRIKYFVFEIMVTQSSRSQKWPSQSPTSDSQQGGFAVELIFTWSVAFWKLRIGAEKLKTTKNCAWPCKVRLKSKRDLWGALAIGKMKTFLKIFLNEKEPILYEDTSQVSAQNIWVISPVTVRSFYRQNLEEQHRKPRWLKTDRTTYLYGLRGLSTLPLSGVGKLIWGTRPRLVPRSPEVSLSWIAGFAEAEGISFNWEVRPAWCQSSNAEITFFRACFVSFFSDLCWYSRCIVKLLVSLGFAPVVWARRVWFCDFNNCFVGVVEVMCSSRSFVTPPPTSIAWMLALSTK